MSGQKALAVVEVGSTGIRLIVAAVEASGEYRVLDHAGKPVQLGRDVFVSGSVSRASMLEVIAVLRGFRELLRTYGIEPKDARVIATSALREADNRDTFTDRIALQTGFSVDIVEDIEENHLMSRLPDRPQAFVPGADGEAACAHERIERSATSGL